MFRNGQLAKREYRAQRSKDAFVKYLKEQMADPIVRMQTQDDLKKIDVSTFNFFVISQYFVGSSMTQCYNN